MVAPAVSISPSHPPNHSPTQDLYRRLHNDSTKNRLLFRVHDALSACKVDWTGEPTTSGFSSLDPTLSKLSPAEYMAYHSYFVGDRWLDDPPRRKGVVDHVLGRGAFPPLGPLKGTGDLPAVSPWIATTRSLDWAIWEVARRLAIGHVPLVRLAIIRQVYCTHEKNRLKVGTEDEVRVNPSRVMQGWEKSSAEVYERQDLMSAGQRANESRETLFYGRVFSRSIEADLVWTAEALPFELPSRFWEPEGNGKAYLPGWLGRLRWDPLLDGWEVARAKMKRSRGVGRRWSGQPIHDWPHHWPPNKRGRSRSSLLRKRNVQPPQTEAVAATKERRSTSDEIDEVAEVIAKAESMALVRRERTLWQVSAYDSDERAEDRGDDGPSGDCGDEGTYDPFGVEGQSSGYAIRL